MDKRFLIDQLSDKLRESATVARKAGQAAADEARDGATAAEKRENARVAQENAGLARGRDARARGRGGGRGGARPPPPAEPRPRSPRWNRFARARYRGERASRWAPSWR